MAGSQPAEFTAPAFSDPILQARLEAIRQLAGGVSDCVAVMDRDFNVVYANEAALQSATSSAEPERQAKCYEAFAARVDPCGTCPAVRVFEAPQVQAVASDDDDRHDTPSCGMHQAFPLTGADGTVSSMLVLFKSRPFQSYSTCPAAASAVAASGSPQGLGDLLGRSPAMRELFDMLRLVANSQATVLIHGESGTGKELVAKTIHRLGSRQAKPFIVVDCGSLPETLLESELFGHVKGAFTGATANKRGLFEEADGGTLFLDEIADTTATFQAKLLRVLQEGEVKRVGSTQPIKIDVRVLSATNKDLSELVTAKKFRQDLYYRLAVLPIHVPALRERKDDIPLLVEHFTALSCQRHHQPVRRVPEDVLQVLSEAPWPGNVRELQHYIERAVVTTAGPTLSCADTMRSAVKEAEGDLKTVGRSAVKQAERVRIIEALKQASGNRVRAAKILKISRASLYLKLRDYEINKTESG
jgi:two-component system response regulator AtoC